MFRLTILFFLVMFVIGTDTFLISPLLPTLQQLFDIPTEAAGWMVGAYALGYALCALIAGPLSDGWDRKKVMLYGMAAFSVSTLLCGFATDFWTMFLFRLLAGVSAAFTAPQVWASIPALSRRRRSPKYPESSWPAWLLPKRSASLSEVCSPPSIGLILSLQSEHSRYSWPYSSTMLCPR